MTYTLAGAAAVALACLAAPGPAIASPTANMIWNTDQAGGILCPQPNELQNPAPYSIVVMVTPHACANDNPIPVWYVPTRNNTGQIRLSGSNLCLQQDNQSDPNIVLNTCGLPSGHGGAAEQWIAHYVTGSPYQTYAFQNSYTKDCLNDDYYLAQMNAAACNDATDQFWQFPTSF